MNGFIRSRDLTRGVCLSLAFAAMVSAGRATEVKVNGFSGTISEAKLVPGSAPQVVKPLANVRTPGDALDLTLMAKWSLNYLAGTVTVENNFASSYGNWPLKMPPLPSAATRLPLPTVKFATCLRSCSCAG